MARDAGPDGRGDGAAGGARRDGGPPRSRGRVPPASVEPPRVAAGARLCARRARGRVRTYDGGLPRRALGGARVARAQEREGRAARAERAVAAPVTLEQARRRAPFMRLPEAAGLGRPDAIYVGGRSVSFVYGERPGYARSTTIGAAVLVQEFPGRVGAFIEKTLGQGAQLERLRVGADPAYFITGAHGFAYEGDEDVRFEDQRLAGNTLLVERADGLLIRVEGDLARDRAVAIAQSIP